MKMAAKLCAVKRTIVLRKGQFLSFFLSLLVRSYMSITPGSANLEILIK